MAKVSQTEKPAPQIPNRLKLRLAALKVFRAMFLLAVIISLLALRGCVVRPASDFPGSHFNRGSNAAWLGVEWVMQSHTPAEIASLVAELHQHQIVYIFVYTTYLKNSGQFNPTYNYAASFVRQLKVSGSDIKVLAWIGLPLSYVDLSDRATRDKITALSGDLVNTQGFDGIHYDPEPIISGDQHVIALLDETRQVLRKYAILSLATHKIYPVAPDGGWERLMGPVLWSGDYYREIARHVDQIAVMTYDSGLVSPVLYRQWSRFQTIQISRSLADSGVQVFMGIPASEEETSTHHVTAESIEIGLRGTIDGLNDNEAEPSVITGLALYPFWEMNPQKWAVFDQFWRGNNSSF